MKGPVFKSNPLRWVYFYLIWMNLPLMWKAKTATWAMKWTQYKRHFKDQLFGEFEVVVLSVDKDWTPAISEHTETPVRDITFRYKRKKLPFAYRKVYQGTQCTDETAFPLGRCEPEKVASLQETIFLRNQKVEKINIERAHHTELKQSIVNHKFQEYDHDL